MRLLAIAPLFLSVATTFAERIAPPTLPPPDFPDTEALKLGINSDGAIRDISLLDGETPIPETQFAAPTAYRWNLLHMTARGINEALENLVVRHSPDGTQLIFR